MSLDAITNQTRQERAILSVLEQHRFDTFSRDGITCHCRPNPPYRLALTWEEHRHHLTEALVKSGYVKDSCSCNTGPSTDGPDEECPVHGRSLADWISYGDEWQERATNLRNTMAEVQAKLERGLEDGKLLAEVAAEAAHLLAEASKR